MMQTTTIKCFGWNQHFDGKYTRIDDDFVTEIEFKHKYGMDDEHLAKKAWQFAYNEITEWDDENWIDTKVLSRISLCGEHGEFEVDSIHQYPSYVDQFVSKFIDM
jgi:hypothetical protein